MSGSALVSAIFAAVVLSIAAAGIFVICWIAAKGILGPNSMAGLRTRRILASEESWRTGHRAALPTMAVASVLTMVAAITSVFVIGNIHAYMVAIISAVVVLLLGAVTATIVASRAAERV